MNTTTTQSSYLSTRTGKLTLALVCLAGFLDFIDTTIVNVALPSIREHLHFSVQNLQWTVSGYLLTYGGFLLLGGRAADLLGRRPVRRPCRTGPRGGDALARRAVDHHHRL